MEVLLWKSHSCCWRIPEAIVVTAVVNSKKKKVMQKTVGMEREVSCETKVRQWPPHQPAWSLVDKKEKFFRGPNNNVLTLASPVSTGLLKQHGLLLGNVSKRELSIDFLDTSPQHAANKLWPLFIPLTHRTF